MNTRLAQRMEGFSPFFVMELLQRAKELERQGRNIIHMEIGEPDFSTPLRVVNAGMQQISDGSVKYTAAAGLPELRKKIAEFYKKTYGLDVPSQRIFITPGASGAFLLALGVTLNAGEEIIMADPCYPCNNNFVQFFGGRTKFVNVNEKTRYQLSADLIEKNWSKNTRGVLIASPSNPTGTLMSNLELKKIIQQVSKLGGHFFSDEIYHGLVYGKKASCALEYSDDVFVINSFSKYFSMTGWRIGWLIVPEQFIDPVERLAQNIFISTATHSQYAALAALSDENIIELESRKKEFKKRRDFLYKHLLRIGFDISVKPDGAFYIYANCSRFTKDSFQFAKDLLEQEGVAVTPGKDFGFYKANCHIRFAYTASIAKIEAAIKRLERFLCQ
ncbi:MAG: aminotransferase class I/II-fold pyridoxal phosphate-dependent enzyme [Methylococcales bacterium]|nr:aminotransferase class I/II-fold pyridoxal phosphate-dependent enzyme [Methylococcales bacterium]